MSRAVELKVYDKGQVVLPIALREKLHLKKGSRVRAFEADGMIYLLPPRSKAAVLRSSGILPARPALSKRLLKVRTRDFA